MLGSENLRLGTSTGQRPVRHVSQPCVGIAEHPNERGTSAWELVQKSRRG